MQYLRHSESDRKPIRLISGQVYTYKYKNDKYGDNRTPYHPYSDNEEFFCGQFSLDFDDVANDLDGKKYLPPEFARMRQMYVLTQATLSPTRSYMTHGAGGAVDAILKSPSTTMEMVSGETSYYKVAELAACKIQDGEGDMAILFCGTGMGVSIVANKFKSVYASVIESEYTAKMAKVINNSNVLTLGGNIISEFKYLNF